MSHREDYRHWPFLNPEEFELACAFFDQRYVRSNLGPTRHLFKVCVRRTMTLGQSYLEVIRLLQLPEDDDELSLAFAKLGQDFRSGMEVEMNTSEEDADCEALHPYPLDSGSSEEDNGMPPAYTSYSHQPYVVYEIHLHPTYSLPTLWFTLHDLPEGQPTFDLEAIYRYLVPAAYKSRLREAGIIGGISAAPHPVTDVPAFFVHPCQTKEAMEDYDCPLENYIVLWLGLVGNCVGLSVPTQLAQ